MIYIGTEATTQLAVDSLYWELKLQSWTEQN